MVSEDFSFPRVRNSVAHFSLSPSLWRVTSLVYPDCDQDEESFYTIECETKKDANIGSESRENDSDKFHVQSEELGSDVNFACEELIYEENMDKLWERLNEDQQRVEEKEFKSEENADRVKMSKMCSVNGLDMRGAANSVLSPRKRYSMVALVKLLKKLFLLHNSAKLKNP